MDDFYKTSKLQPTFLVIVWKRAWKYAQLSPFVFHERKRSLLERKNIRPAGFSMIFQLVFRAQVSVAGPVQRATEEHENRDSIHAAGQRNLPWTRVSNRWEKRASWNKDHFLTVAWVLKYREDRERESKFYRRLKHPQATPMKTSTKGAHIKRNLFFSPILCGAFPYFMNKGFTGMLFSQMMYEHKSLYNSSWNKKGI